MEEEGGKKTQSDQGRASSDGQSVEEKNAQKTQPVSYQYPPSYPSFILKNKSKIAIVIGVIIVVGFVISSLIFIFVINSGLEKPGVFIDLDITHPDNLGINVIIDSGTVLSLRGVANLGITYRDREVYNSKVEIDKSGNGFISVPYNSFIEENGEYLFIAEYKDVVSPLKIYNVRYIVERLDISANVDFVDGDGQLAINVHMLEEDGRSMRDSPKDVILTVNEIKLIDDGTYITHDNPPQIISESYYKNEYPYNKSGNYLINITLENTRVNPNSDSPYLAIKEIWEGSLNILPRPAVRILDTYPAPNSTNYTVEFDASPSWNDGDITKYIWDFNGDGVIDLKTTEPEVNFSEYNQGSNYNALLNVEGDVIIDPYLDYLKKGALLIDIYTP